MYGSGSGTRTFTVRKQRKPDRYAFLWGLCTMLCSDTVTLCRTIAYVTDYHSKGSSVQLLRRKHVGVTIAYVFNGYRCPSPLGVWRPWLRDFIHYLHGSHFPSANSIIQHHEASVASHSPCHGQLCHCLCPRQRGLPFPCVHQNGCC